MSEGPYIIKTDLPFHRGAWVFVENGRYRRITSVESLKKYKECFHQKSENEFDLNSIRRGPPAPTSPDASFDPNISRSVTLGKFRENFGLSALGRGIEVGAGGRPLTVAVGSDVLYIDRFSNEEMMSYSSARHGAKRQDLVEIDLVDSIEELGSFSDGELNFIIAAHVIEHLTNPIGMIETASRKLSYRGQLILIVPDCNRTHDRNRPVTTIEHLVSDYYLPSRERDFEHYLERLCIVDRIDISDREKFIAAWRDRMDLHLHTFNFHSFLSMSIFVEKITPMKLVWSHDGLLYNSKSQEMYFLFERG